MATSWWPLNTFSLPSSSPSATVAAAANAGENTSNATPLVMPSTLSKPAEGRSEAVPSTAATAGAAAAIPPNWENHNLTQAAFHTSLENLLVESTKHRSLELLRDAVQKTRRQRFDPSSLFYTLCMACELLAERTAGEAGAGVSANAVAVSSSVGNAGAGAGMRAALSSTSSANGGALYSMTTGAELPHTAVTGVDILTSSTTSARLAAPVSLPCALHYRYHATSRVLLLQSISDVGKLIALGLLPVTQSVSLRITALVRKLAFQSLPTDAPTSPQAAPLLTPSATSRSPVTASERPFTRWPDASQSLPPNAPLEERRIGGELDGSAPRRRSSSPKPAAAATTGSVALFHDEPVLVRLLQLVAATASSSPPGSPDLAEIYGVLLVIYSGVEASSMLEATCEATLAHHIHAAMAALRDSGHGDLHTSVSPADAGSWNKDPPPPRSGTAIATFTAQLQGVAFLRDICRLVIGVPTRWLHYGSCSTGGAGSAAVLASPSAPDSIKDDTSKRSGDLRSGTACLKTSAPSSMAQVETKVLAAALEERRQRHQLAQTGPVRAPSLASVSLSGGFVTAVSVDNNEDDDGGGDAHCSVTKLAPSPRHNAAPSRTPIDSVPERVRLFLTHTIVHFFREQTTPSLASLTAPYESVMGREGKQSQRDGSAGGGGKGRPSGCAAVASPMADTTSGQSALYTQFLNDAILSVALWGMYEVGVKIPMQPPPPLFAELLQQRLTASGDPSPPPRSRSNRHHTESSSDFAGCNPCTCSLDVFAGSQQLALAAVSANFVHMNNSLQVLLRAHEELLRRLCQRRCRSAASRGAGVASPIAGVASLEGSVGVVEWRTQAATAVVSLWRKTLSNTALLWAMLRLRPARYADDRRDGGLIEPAEPSAEDAAPLPSRGWRSVARRSGAPATTTVGDRDGRHGEGGGTPVTSPLQSLSLTYDTAFAGKWSTLKEQDEEVGEEASRGNGGAADDDVSERASLSGEDVATAADALATEEVPSLVCLVRAVLALVASIVNAPSVAHMAGETALAAPLKVGEGSSGVDRKGSSTASNAPLPTASFSSSISPPSYNLKTTEGSQSDLKVSRSSRPDSLSEKPLILHAAPVTVYQCLTEALNLLSTFGQLLAQLTQTASTSAGAAAIASAASPELLRCRECFLWLHPYLLHCEGLCLRHLRYEEDLVPVVLKASGYWVQVSCILKLPEQRDAYLDALVDLLRLPDPIAQFLAALAPLPSHHHPSMSNLANPATVELLEALVALHRTEFVEEPLVPGSVAAAAATAAAAPGDAFDHSDGGHRPSTTENSSGGGVVYWGMRWLRRRRQVFASGLADGKETPMSQTSGGVGRTGARLATRPPVVTSGGQKAPTVHGPSLSISSSLAPSTPLVGASVLADRSWRSSAVQNVVILAACRLQHKLLVMKTLHVTANTLGMQLQHGWVVLAHGFAFTEPLLHMLKHVLLWVEESADGQDQLLSDALHLRDALRSLCLSNTCQLPQTQFELFFRELTTATVHLEVEVGASKKSEAFVRALAEAEQRRQDQQPPSAVHSEDVDVEPRSPSTPQNLAAALHCLSRSHPQSCAQQWTLTSECLCVSLLGLLPFIDLRYADTAEGAGDSGGVTNRSCSEAALLQRQRTGALARALLLWELEASLCLCVTNQESLAQWAVALAASASAPNFALSAGLAKASATATDLPYMGSSLVYDGARVTEQLLTALVEHVVTVAVQMCRSTSRSRVRAVRGDENGSVVMDLSLTESSRTTAAVAHATSTPFSSYQAMQSAALVLASGPFAMVPLTHIVNALFATSTTAATASPSPSGAALASGVARAPKPGGEVASRQLPILPFVPVDAAQGTGTTSLLTALQRSANAIACYAPLTSSGEGTARGAESISRRCATVSAPFPDPLQQLMASPFALLDFLYHDWCSSREGSSHNTSADGSRKRHGTEAERSKPSASQTASPSSSMLVALTWQQTGDSGASTGGNAARAPPPLATLAVAKAAATATVLSSVVKMVQAYGEDIDGAAWDAILSIFQRTAEQGGGAAAVATEGRALHRDAQDATVVSASNTMTTAVPSVTYPGNRSSGSSGDGGVYATINGSQAAELLNTAFRALESIQHNYTPRLPVEGLYRLIVCVGAFSVHHSVDGRAATAERKLHTNLSAVQLLWSIADYLATCGGEDRGATEIVDEGVVDAAGIPEARRPLNGSPSRSAGSKHRPLPSQREQQQQQDRLWCAVLLQLRRACLDDRQGIRQSALQTYFALVQSYGGRFSWTCWRCVLLDVLQPLMEVMMMATPLCALLPAAPASATPVRVFSVTDAVSAVKVRGVDDASVPPLLQCIADHPADLEEMRVTLFDAGSRLFVRHYAAMLTSAAEAHAARHPGGVSSSPLLQLQDPSPPSPQQSGSAVEKEGQEAASVLEMFLKLCGEVCVVLRGTTGESSALAAVHAIHGLLVEMPERELHPHAKHLAWRALERLQLRSDGDDAGHDAVAAMNFGAAGAPYAHTEATQCTIAVVAAMVAAACDSFRLQKLMAVGTQDAGEAQRPATQRSSYFGLRSGSRETAGAAAPSPSSATNTSTTPMEGGWDASSTTGQYFIRLLVLLRAVTSCPAVVNSYYFPSKAQVTLLEGVEAVWPTLSTREARMFWGEVLLPAFPSPDVLIRFVLRNGTSVDGAEVAVSPSTIKAAAVPHPPLRAVLPPGSHPSYLSAVMSTMRSLLQLHLGVNAASDAPTTPSDSGPPSPSAAAAPSRTSLGMGEEDGGRLAFMAPSAIHSAGTLLLLRLDPSSAAAEGAAHVGNSPHLVPVDFLRGCVDFLQFALWEAALVQPPGGANAFDTTSEMSAQCRRDGVTALCSVFENLLAATSSVVRRLGMPTRINGSTATGGQGGGNVEGAAHTHSSATATVTTIAPTHVMAALQYLDLLVDTLGEVVQVVVSRYEDVPCAMVAIDALSGASTAEGVALTRVARRSLSLLQRWAGVVGVAGPTDPPPPPRPNETPRSGDEGRLMAQAMLQSFCFGEVSTLPLTEVGRAPPSKGAGAAPVSSMCSQLQDAARASMESRNRATVKQFLEHPTDISAGVLLVDTLRDVLHATQLYRTARERSGVAAAVPPPWHSVMPELLQLVATCSDEPTRSAAAIACEKEMRKLLSQLLMEVMEAPLALRRYTPTAPRQQQQQVSVGEKEKEVLPQGTLFI